MISSIFSLFRAILGLTEYAATSVATKLEANKPRIQSKLEAAAKHIKDRCESN